MKKSCRSCKFLIHYGGNEYDCSNPNDCSVRDKDIEHPDPSRLIKDRDRENNARYKIPKI